MIIKVFKHIINSVMNTFRFQVMKTKYKRMNKNNFTSLLCRTNINLISVGNYTYGGINVLNLNGNNKLKIGHFCSIAHDVTFVVCADHEYKYISTFPFKAIIQKKGQESVSKGDIIVDDDVWIGFGATILSGVHIHQGAIIGANAVVSKDVPPYAVIVGNPGRVVRYRFDKDTISKLCNIDYSRIDNKFIMDNIEMFYSDPEKSDLSCFPHRKEKY